MGRPRKKPDAEPAPKAAKKPKGQRTEMCIHRNPPTTFCSRCDA